MFQQAIPPKQSSAGVLMPGMPSSDELWSNDAITQYRLRVLMQDGGRRASPGATLRETPLSTRVSGREG